MINIGNNHLIVDNAYPKFIIFSGDKVQGAGFIYPSSWQTPGLLARIRCSIRLADYMGTYRCSLTQKYIRQEEESMEADSDNGRSLGTGHTLHTKDYKAVSDCRETGSGIYFINLIWLP